MVQSNIPRDQREPRLYDLFPWGGGKGRTRETKAFEWPAKGTAEGRAPSFKFKPKSEVQSRSMRFDSVTRSFKS